MRHTLKPKKQPESLPPETTPSTQGSWSRKVVLTVCLLAAFGATWATFEFIVWSRLPTALLGEWELKSGGEGGMTFFRDGSMEARFVVDGAGRIVQGHASVQDNTLSLTTMNLKKQTSTKSYAIKTLTDRELVLQDADVVFRFERASRSRREEP